MSPSFLGTHSFIQYIYPQTFVDYLLRARHISIYTVNLSKKNAICIYLSLFLRCMFGILDGIAKIRGIFFDATSFSSTGPSPVLCTLWASKITNGHFPHCSLLSPYAVCLKISTNLHVEMQTPRCSKQNKEGELAFGAHWPRLSEPLLFRVPPFGYLFYFERVNSQLILFSLK